MKGLSCSIILVAACGVLAQSVPQSLPDLPPPTAVLQDKKQFNALTFGPGNTFSVQQTPPDFELDSFSVSPDGKWAFMGWASGRLEVRDLETGSRIAQFRPIRGPVYEADYIERTKQLLVTGPHGVIRFVDPHSGKMQREIQTEIGKYKYDLQKVLVAQDASWLAYVNQENGKILDLTSDPPKVLADLGDAYDLALTQDKSEIWTINREKLIGLKAGSWKVIASAPLLDRVQPTGTPTLAIASSSDGAVAFVPSQSGLLWYALNTMKGRKLTQNPAFWTAADRSGNEVLVNELHALSLYTPDGALHCQWKQHPSRGLTISGNGEWLGSLDFGKVELWSLKSLRAVCADRRP